MMPTETLPKKGPAPEQDATDLALFVRTSSDNIVGWNRERIIAALIRETNIDQEIAEVIGGEVEEQIKSLNLRTVTAPLVRELVDVKLLEHGLEEARRRHTRLGSPLHDVKEIIYNQNKENANVPHGPEATNLTLSEGIKKTYIALLFQVRLKML